MHKLCLAFFPAFFLALLEANGERRQAFDIDLGQHVFSFLDPCPEIPIFRQDLQHVHVIAESPLVGTQQLLQAAHDIGDNPWGLRSPKS